MHLCLLKLKDNKQALLVLQSVPSKQRKAKINMAIAKLSHQMGNIVLAVTSYNRVLKVIVYNFLIYIFVDFCVSSVILMEKLSLRIKYYLATITELDPNKAR